MEITKAKCSKCGSGYVYVRIDGTIVCRQCGHIQKQKEHIK